MENYEYFYAKISSPFRKNELALKLLKSTNFILALICYILFPLLIILLFLAKGEYIKVIVTSAVPFILVTLFRMAFNKARPYEKYNITPLIQKDTKGKSFPSRHVFSNFVIAMCWLWYCKEVGIFLIICGFLLAVIRVIIGVHYISDVFAGAIIGIISGLFMFI